jgi:chromosome segregation ATPase
MKQVLTKEDVSKAIADLAQQGKRPTLAAIHAALNHRGSMSTLVRLKSELQAAAQSPNDSPEALNAFRQTWAMAVAEGRQQQDVVVAELRESVGAVAAENERLEGLLVAAQNRSRELDEARSRAESGLRELEARVQAELDETRSAAAEANAKAAGALGRLAETQEKHAKQMAALQSERDDAVTKAHEMEIRFVRAQALLEAPRTVGGFQEQA